MVNGHFKKNDRVRLKEDYRGYGEGHGTESGRGLITYYSPDSSRNYVRFDGCKCGSRSHASCVAFRKDEDVLELDGTYSKGADALKAWLGD